MAEIVGVKRSLRCGCGQPAQYDVFAGLAASKETPRAQQTIVPTGCAVCEFCMLQAIQQLEAQPESFPAMFSVQEWQEVVAWCARAGKPTPVQAYTRMYFAPLGQQN